MDLHPTGLALPKEKGCGEAHPWTIYLLQGQINLMWVAAVQCRYFLDLFAQASVPWMVVQVDFYLEFTEVGQHRWAKLRVFAAVTASRHATRLTGL